MKTHLLAALLGGCLAAAAVAGPGNLNLASLKAGSGDGKPLSEADRKAADAADFLNSSATALSKNRDMQFFSPKEGADGTRGSDGRKLFKKCAPSVVALLTPDGRGLGSGTLVDDQGTILTNWHVVEGQSEMLVLCYSPDFSSWNDIAVNDLEQGTVIATDSRRDLALVRLWAGGKKSFATLGKEDELEVAQDVFAIGHPLEQLWTFTYGVISAIRPKYDWSYGEGTAFRARVIQTQTPINPGNSGGPLFDDDGRLIGMNSFKSGEGEGLNYAVHLSEIREFIENSRTGRYPVEPGRTKPSATQASASGSGGEQGKVQGTPIDSNQDGKTDIWGYDTNGNGVLDFYVVDENQDGVTDYAIADLDENQQGEIFMYDDDKNGTYEHWFVDTDLDGTLDLEGWDDNGDLQLDRSQPYRG